MINQSEVQLQEQIISEHLKKLNSAEKNFQARKKFYRKNFPAVRGHLFEKTRLNGRVSL